MINTETASMNPETLVSDNRTSTLLRWIAQRAPRGDPTVAILTALATALQRPPRVWDPDRTALTWAVELLEACETASREPDPRGRQWMARSVDLARRLLFTLVVETVWLHLDYWSLEADQREAEEAAGWVTGETEVIAQGVAIFVDRRDGASPMPTPTCPEGHRRLQSVHYDDALDALVQEGLTHDLLEAWCRETGHRLSTWTGIWVPTGVIVHPVILEKDREETWRPTMALGPELMRKLHALGWDEWPIRYATNLAWDRRIEEREAKGYKGGEEPPTRPCLAYGDGELDRARKDITQYGQLQIYCDVQCGVGWVLETEDLAKVWSWYLERTGQDPRPLPWTEGATA